jgi:hypothetical protein
MTGYLLIALFAGMASALWLYARQKTFTRPQSILLGGLRGLSVFLIFLLFLGWIIKRSSREIIKPVVVLLADNSASLLATSDSVWMRERFPDEWEKLTQQLFSNEYEVARLRFSGFSETSTTLDFLGKETNIAAALHDVSIRYANRNVAAVILASDGIVNSGADPLFILDRLNFPVYTVALGDSTRRLDLRVAQVRNNEVVFSGNKFSIEVTIDADKAEGKESMLRISGADERYEVRLNFTSVSESQTHTFSFTAGKPGIARYRIEIVPIEGENNKENNRRDVLIEVIDSRQKILLAAAAPHPDLGAIRRALETNEHLEVIVQIGKQDALPEAAESFSLAILVQLPHQSNGFKQSLQQLNTASIPCWHVLGGGSDLNVFNSLQTGLRIRNPLPRLDEVQSLANQDFSLFFLPAELAEMLPRFPPLSVPFGDIERSAAGEALLLRSVTGVKTDIPVWMVSDFSGQKQSVLAGEGIWKWRMQAYARTQSHAAFDQLVRGLVQYLAMREDKQPFRVRVAQKFTEGQPVRFSAALYNPGMEPIRGAEISLKLTNQDGKEFIYVFSPSGDSYSLDAGILPAGEYSWQAQTSHAGRNHKREGYFRVEALVLEWQQTRANVELMRQLALQSSGRMVLPAQLSDIPEMLDARDDIQGVSREVTKKDELISWKILLALLIISLGLEWSVRKYLTGV